MSTMIPASFRETCQWLKFPLNGLRAQSRVSPAVGLLPLASGPACLGMVFPPFLVKQLYRCDLVARAFNREELQNIAKEIKQYQEKWLQHVQRMDTDRIPKQELQLFISQ